jgi:hypothetical protein
MATYLQVGGDVALQHPEVGGCHECVEGIILGVTWAAPECGGTQVGTCAGQLHRAAGEHRLVEQKYVRVMARAQLEVDRL